MNFEKKDGNNSLSQTTRNTVNEHFRNMYGISYDQFMQLDEAEQRRLEREQYEKYPQLSSSKALVMVGSGSNSLFMKVEKGTRVMVGTGDESIFVTTGETEKESLQRLDERIEASMQKQSFQKSKKLFGRIRR